MRKSAKERKALKQNKNTFVNSNDEAYNFIKILASVILFVIIFTIITVIVVNKENKKASSPSEIQYTEIIVGNILNRKEESYYVLVNAINDENLSLYQNYISLYNKKDEHLKIYTVDLNDGFNSNYLSDKSNFDISTINDIKFSQTTLLKIKSGKITKHIENADDIKSYLKDLSA